MSTAFLTLLVLLPALAERYNGSVLVLTDTTFKDAVVEHEYLFVKIYAPWCPHCKRLEPEWKEAAERLEELGSMVVMAEIDGSSNIQTSLSQQIRGYPTLDFFYMSHSVRYAGARNSQALINYALNQTQESFP